MRTSRASLFPRPCATSQAAVRIMREEGGPQALMRGAGLRAATYAPSALIFFFVYGWIKRVAGLR